MKNYLSLIKFSHTVFAMPFALVGFILALYKTEGGIHSENNSNLWLKLLQVLLCMIFARSAAMAFNRYLDRHIDAANPRTAKREIPAGIISANSALLFVIVNCGLFVLTTWFINKICFYLSPLALLIILGYSFTKRFTALCHFVLGFGLSLAPIGAYLAVTGRFDWLPLIYSTIVLLWVSGFDIIYALQDEDFDKSLSLNSIPVRLGKKNALLLSKILHSIASILMIVAVKQTLTEGVLFSWLHVVGAIIFIILLIYQHTIVKTNDLSKVNLAFFTTNGIASVIYGICFVADYFL